MRHSLDLMAVVNTQKELNKIHLDFKKSTTLDDYNRVHEEFKGNIEKLRSQILLKEVNIVIPEIICTRKCIHGQM